jgi:hypothetical protein
MAQITLSSFKPHGSGMAMNGSNGNLGLNTSDTRCLDEPLDKGLEAWRGEEEEEARGDEEEAI